MIREGGAGPNMHIVFENKTVPKINTTFYGYPVANSHSAFNEGVVANVAVITHDGAFDDMSERPDPCPVPEGDSAINQRLGMYETVWHFRVRVGQRDLPLIACTDFPGPKLACRAVLV